MKLLTKMKWRVREAHGAIRGMWWRLSGYADRLERENRELKAAADLRFKQYVEARDIAYQLHYPPIDAGGALLLAAAKVSEEGPASPCEQAWQEGSTGAWNCDAARRDEICWCFVADELRQLEKALRDAAPYNVAAITRAAAEPSTTGDGG